MNQLNSLTDDVKENELKLPNCTTLKGRSCPFPDECIFTYQKRWWFSILLNDLNVNFDVLAITESPIKKDWSSLINLPLNN